MEISFMITLLSLAVVFIIMEITRLNRQVKELKVEVNLLSEKAPSPDIADDESKDIKVAKDKFGLSLVEAQQLINEQRIEKQRGINK